MATCQPLEPWLAWAAPIGAMPELRHERQPPGARPQRDFPMR
jgi:hypothetical protein